MKAMPVRLATRALAALCLTTCLPSHAWDGVVTSTISRIDITAGDNYGVRVWLSGVTTMCTGATDGTWAYLNDADSNYKVYVAALLAAKAQGSKVQVFSNVGPTKYCHIGYISISN